MPEESRVTRVANALCVADGNDPEEHIYVGRQTVETDSPDEYREMMGPAWTIYVREARRMIAAMRALGLVE